MPFPALKRRAILTSPSGTFPLANEAEEVSREDRQGRQGMRIFATSGFLAAITVWCGARHPAFPALLCVRRALCVRLHPLVCMVPAWANFQKGMGFSPSPVARHHGPEPRRFNLVAHREGLAARHPGSVAQPNRPAACFQGPEARLRNPETDVHDSESHLTAQVPRFRADIPFSMMTVTSNGSGFKIRSRRGDEADGVGFAKISASSRRRLRTNRNFETTSKPEPCSRNGENGRPARSRRQPAAEANA